MKLLFSFLLLLLFVSCAKGKENNYTGSTPADPVVRSFLGISLTDSVDFIRWQLTFTDNSYKLHCNYGIGKPNTNEFINGGKTIVLNGELKKENNYYTLINGTATLKIAELNKDLLHLSDAENNLLVGNGGWSYTLNNMSATGTDQVNITAASTALKDSMVFDGRTPCAIPGLLPAGTTCYKLKWRITLYANAAINKPTTYKIAGTGWRNENRGTGTWKIVTGKNSRTIYQLHDDKGNAFLYLLKLNGYILVFTDLNGQLLVGNKDFSYTMNRISE